VRSFDWVVMWASVLLEPSARPFPGSGLEEFVPCVVGVRHDGIEDEFV
jgi:hypothetical protein